MSAPGTLRVCALHPARMNIYADRGNLMVLEARCRARSIGWELTANDVGSRLTVDDHDLFLFGGGQDADQRLVAEDLRGEKGSELRRAADDGKTFLAVCGGLQLLGEYFELSGERVTGLGMVDLRTRRVDGPRLTGNIAIEAELAGERRLLAGFENHAGRTELGDGVKPLGRVLRGHGNNGRDQTEGVHWKNVHGTYLHGPLLPKNSWFADHLIETALGLEAPLEPLDDELERRVHRGAVRAAGVQPPEEAR